MYPPIEDEKESGSSSCVRSQYLVDQRKKAFPLTDAAEFDKQKAQLTESALSEQRNQVFDEYLTNARRQLEEKGRIEIYNDTLARLLVAAVRHAGVEAESDWWNGVEFVAAADVPAEPRISDARL